MKSLHIYKINLDLIMQLI